MKRVGAFLVFLLCFFWLFSGCSLLSTEPNLWETIDHTHPDSKFGGIMWWPVQSEQALMGSKTYSESRHSFAEFEFEGSAVRWIGTKGPTKGIADIYLNGEIVFEGLDTYSPTTEYQQVIAELFNLEPGKNVLRINVTGKKNPKSRGANVTIDGFQYIPTGKRAIELAEDILTSEYGEVFAKRAPEAVIKLRSKIEVARQRLATEVSKDEELTIVRDLKLAREEFEQQLVAGGVVGKISFGTGRWDIIDGVISQQSLATDHRAFFGDPNWRNYEFELEAKKTGGAEGFLIIVGAKDSKNLYWVNIGGWGNTQSTIEHEVNGNRSVIRQFVPESLETDIWYNIRIAFRANRLEYYRNGQLVFTENVGGKGMVGLGTWATSAEFRNLKVRALDGSWEYKPEIWIKE